MEELQSCLMQGELFLGQDLIVHFHLSAGWAKFFFFFVVPTGFSVATQGQAGIDELLVGAILALLCETSLECGYSSFGAHVSHVTALFR